MLKNFFTVAVRAFLRQKFYSLINVFGLASGLTCALLIGLWVNDEIQKDRFHHDVDRIAHIRPSLNWAGDVVTWQTSPGQLADEIKANIPEVQYVTRAINEGRLLLHAGDKNFLEKGFFADPEFFKVFSYRIIQGDAQNPLPDKSSVVISRKVALNLFGTVDVVGKVIHVQKRYDQKITAVMDDISEKTSSMTFDVIMPFEIHKEYTTLDWSNFNYLIYLKVNNANQLETASVKINAHLDKIFYKQDNKYKNEDINLYLQPYAETYLHSNFQNGVPSGGRIHYVVIFSIVAAFILVIACINFMNMATAHAANRSKEVGVRKASGALRSSLIIQFITESVIISFVSAAVALLLVQLLLPFFNTLVSKQIVVPYDQPIFIGAFVTVVIFTGVLAGSYPAFFLSAFRPAQVLKGNTTPAFSGATLRKGLVIFQFSLTVVLIACAIVVHQQVDFIRNANLGYDRSSVLHFNGRALTKNFETFRAQALENSAIKNVSRSNNILVQVENQTNSLKWPGKAEDNQQLFRAVVVDYDFIETMALKLKEGRSFSKDFNDTTSFILSQKSVDAMGLTNPIGTKISLWGIEGPVVGVVEDFHSRSLHEAVDPTVLLCTQDNISEVHVRFEAGKAQEVIGYLEKIFKESNPEFPFEYYFLDDSFDKLYQTEKVTGFLAISFTCMAIIISGLGLLGLAAYTAEKKKKEISIRKIMGASVPGIVSMISKDFLRLTLIATFIGCPVAYYLMNLFLSSYEFHTPLSWQPFILTALVTMLFTMVTIIVQVTKASLSNPVDALRNE